MSELNENELTKKLYGWHKEGQACRRDGGSTPYPGNSLAHTMHAIGWVEEDLRLALIKADPKYAASQGNPKVFDYVAEAVKTMSNKFYGRLVTKARVLQTLHDFIHAAAELDKVKKALFYGRTDFYDGSGDLGHENAYALRIDFKLADGFYADNGQVDNLLHGIIGAATEAGELVEALFKAFGGQPLDLVNIKEESGDLKWYLAILAREAGFEWGEDEQVNIAKLRARFPDKFTEAKANERDLGRERAILETGGQPIPPNVGIDPFRREAPVPAELETPLQKVAKPFITTQDGTVIRRPFDPSERNGE